MNACDQYIKHLETTLPKICYVEDLIECGIYRSDQAAAYARRNGISPPYLKMGNTVVYQKLGIIDFLRSAALPCKLNSEIQDEDYSTRRTNPNGKTSHVFRKRVQNKLQSKRKGKEKRNSSNQEKPDKPIAFGGSRNSKSKHVFLHADPKVIQQKVKKQTAAGMLKQRRAA